ncbi:phosphoglycolate phosphatase [Rhodocyclus tenuis]|uniref:Phosphoglycolate phosphatase n=2 Tax=Rhodocyclus TaxID=1064 RepID=A0A6L5K182_RHOTE|nr:phosphoglycolate phosphatase [Rhodocyclus gracilis]MQY52268.1 phosphoglycolate phosphatase [Rhodocyclus gracilis]MRD73856.1 phosphoglycolate phosphatase [Rhodocyclus gracilis]NJA89874.1 phosphoglycolate phosphatase [Rhodocyclus gracilis]
MRIRSLTIDLDGTLLDTVGDLAVASNAMLADLSLPARSLAEINAFVGKGMAVLVERCLGAASSDAALVARAIERFRVHYAEANGHSTRLYPGVLDGLDALRRLGFPLACVTNKPAMFTEPLLARMGIADYFAVVVSGDTLPFKKPRPEPLWHACAAMGSEPAANLHVGDSANDIAAARAAGCPVICVPYGYNEGRPVDSAECDALVSDLVEAASYAASLVLSPPVPRGRPS